MSVPADAGDSGVPVIAIDGPAASGKGTIAAGVASELGYHLLDSGSLYRLVALKALDAKIALDSGSALAEAARRLDVTFAGGRIRMEGRDVTEGIRAEDVSAAASRDAGRAVAPLVPAADAVILDTTDLSIEAATRAVVDRYRALEQTGRPRAL